MEFFYHRPKTSKTQGRVTIAAYMEGNELVFGASKCCETDQFKKETARNKALGRARSENKFIHDCQIPENVRPVDLFLNTAKALADAVHSGHNPCSYLPTI